MKTTPTYDLNIIKQAFSNVNKLNMTASAMQGQYALAFSDQDVVDTIQALDSTDFYKSMPPAHHGFSAWQDVYKPTFNNVKLYLKFQVDSRGDMIISFKVR
jgi:motility quorum-sensing regulator/GCU-specific mRNA interferase toxin